MRLPNTLFARTSLTISAALIIFILFTGVVIFNYLLMPVARQSADDLAALMVLSAKTWVELPPDARHDFQVELRKNHDLLLAVDPPTDNMTALVLHSPYMLFLEDALSSRIGFSIHIHKTQDKGSRYWAIIPSAEKKLYLGILHERVGAQPPQAMFFILLAASLFIMLTALFVVRRITQPLQTLSQGVKLLGISGFHIPLSEEGPLELATLAKKFNQLSVQVQQLLENRTTLLGGISHDLRTPLARLTLGITLLNGKEEETLLQRMQQDVDEMDLLIKRTLELAQVMRQDDEPISSVSLRNFLQDLVAVYKQDQKHILLTTDGSCRSFLNTLALRRILTNLLDNAFYYAGDEDVALHMQCDASLVTICVQDKGSGIPEEQMEKVFQPFYRLDDSRNRSTGGSGLGLAIVRQLAQLQGWTITLKNIEAGGLSACISFHSRAD